MRSIVPTIDLSGWASGDPQVRAALAAEIDEACRTVGFLEVTGHGVDPGLIERMLAVTSEFFDLPEDEKLRYVPPSPAINRGYARLGSEALAYSLGLDTKPDLFEAFNMGVEGWPEDDPYFADHAQGFFARNIWPERPAELREVWVAYFAAACSLAQRLMDIFAVALGLPEQFFVPSYDKAPNVMRANNFERRAGAPEAEPGQMRMGAHSDYGSCTVLLADPVPGLQILGVDGSWHDVVPRPGSFLVNLGDLLAEWTNDRWLATVHRVVPPPPGTGGPFRRRSIAFFHEANYDFLVECLPTCVSADRPAKYPPVTAGDHLLAKLMGPRTLRKSDALSTLGDREPLAGA
jgi:isopenicillin N synthase-like dioxygenase